VSTSDVVFIAGVVLLGFALFAVRPVIHRWLMDLTPPRLGGSAISLLFGTQAALSAIVPIIGGIIADVWGRTVVFYFLVGTTFVPSFLVYLLPHHNPETAASVRRAD